MKKLIGNGGLAAAAGWLLINSIPAEAQSDHVVVEDDYGTEVVAQDYRPLSDREIENLIGPIALYPDDLVSIVLPAATYPVQVVQAARFLEQREGNPELDPPNDWDDAVVALLNYPEVIELMNDDLDWTWALGEAFLNQQSEVLVAISDFRDEAYAAGNLRSDQNQVVRRQQEVIYIEPADPEVIYVPYYEPERVIVYQPYPVYHYHPYPRYSYYYPYPADYGFSYGYFFGVSTAFRLHWAHHSLYTYHYGYRGHPYFGRGYHHRFYYRHSPYRYSRGRHARSRGGYAGSQGRGDRWRPRGRHGPRPQAGARHSGGRLAADRPGRSQRGGVDRPGRRGGADGTHSRRRGDNGRQTPRNRGGLGEPRADRGNGAVNAGRAQGQRVRSDRPRHAYSDKDPEQKRLVRRYREDAASSRRQNSNRRATTRQQQDPPRRASSRSRVGTRVAERPRAESRSSARRDEATRTHRNVRRPGNRASNTQRTRTEPRRTVTPRRASTRPTQRTTSRQARPRASTRPARPKASTNRQVARRAAPAQQRTARPAQRRAAPQQRAQRPAKREPRATSGGKQRERTRRSEPRRR